MKKLRKLKVKEQKQIAADLNLKYDTKAEELIQECFSDVHYPINIFRLKYQLLAYGLVKDNKYLDLYLQLITDNLQTEKTKFETQQHHCIPLGIYVKAFKLKNISVNPRKLGEILVPGNLLVNLKFKDHLLAHWYLYKCSKQHDFKLINFRACVGSINNFWIKKANNLYWKFKLAKFVADEDKLNQLQHLYAEELKKRGLKVVTSKQKAE